MAKTFKYRFVRDPMGEVPAGVPVVWVVPEGESYKAEDGVVVWKDGRKFGIPNSNVISVETLNA